MEQILGFGKRYADVLRPPYPLNLKKKIDLPEATLFVYLEFNKYSDENYSLKEVVNNYLTVHKRGKGLRTYTDWYTYWCCRRYWKEVTTPKKFRDINNE